MTVCKKSGLEIYKEESWPKGLHFDVLNIAVRVKKKDLSNFDKGQNYCD